MNNKLILYFATGFVFSVGVLIELYVPNLTYVAKISQYGLSVITLYYLALLDNQVKNQSIVTEHFIQDFVNSKKQNKDKENSDTDILIREIYNRIVNNQDFESIYKDLNSNGYSDTNITNAINSMVNAGIIQMGDDSGTEQKVNN